MPCIVFAVLTSQRPQSSGRKHIFALHGGRAGWEMGELTGGLLQDRLRVDALNMLLQAPRAWCVYRTLFQVSLLTPAC